MTASDTASDRPVGGVWRAALAVAEFQLGRLMTPQRLGLALAGVAFPAAVMLAVRRIDVAPDRDFIVVLVYALVPEAVCMLGLLVTMCPAVADELERGTWPHVTVRPHGRRGLLLGSYLAAVAWTAAIGLPAAVLALMVSGVDDIGPLACMFAGLVTLSCIGRAALFSLPAVIVPKRALVASVATALVVEYLLGFLPAVVNQLTVGLRLRSLLVAWMRWGSKMPAEMQLIVDPLPPGSQVAAVLLLAVVLLTVAVLILERREFPPSEEA